MLQRRVITALALALAWCWGAWHQDLEGAGWMFDHQHHHSDHHGSEHSASHDHGPLTDDDHEPVWARDVSHDARVLPFLQLLLAVAALAGLWTLTFQQRLTDPCVRCRLQRLAWSFGRVWHFVRRCAPDVAAPPALR
jgi:hypothetical protein